MGLNAQNGYGMYAIRSAYKKLSINDAGIVSAGAPRNEGSTLYHHMKLLTAVQPQAAEKKVATFDPFTWDGSKFV
jgi:hypothetical protein